MEKWLCSVCNYIYDEQEGDPDNGIQSDTSFSELPEDWACPLCEARKSEFQKL